MREVDGEVARRSGRRPGVILGHFRNPGKERAFVVLRRWRGDSPRPSPRAPRARPAAGGPSRPRARRPRQDGPRGSDHHTLMVRRRMAAGVGVVLVIVIVLAVSGCLKSQAHEELKEYNRQRQPARPGIGRTGLPARCSTTLASAAGKSALNVELQVDQLHIQAQNVAAQAKALSVPGAMAEAQRDLLLALDMRVEGLDQGGCAAADGAGRAGQIELLGQRADRRARWSCSWHPMSSTPSASRR